MVFMNSYMNPYDPFMGGMYYQSPIEELAEGALIAGTLAVVGFGAFKLLEGFIKGDNPDRQNMQIGQENVHVPAREEIGPRNDHLAGNFFAGLRGLLDEVVHSLTEVPESTGEPETSAINEPQMAPDIQLSNGWHISRATREAPTEGAPLLLTWKGDWPTSDLGLDLRTDTRRDALTAQLRVLARQRDIEAENVRLTPDNRIQVDDPDETKLQAFAQSIIDWRTELQSAMDTAEPLPTNEA